MKDLDNFCFSFVQGGPTVPCKAERESAGPNDLLPECDEFGHYLPKQCNGDSTMCWCVSQCGDVLMETKGGPDLVCGMYESFFWCYGTVCLYTLKLTYEHFISIGGLIF